MGGYSAHFFIGDSMKEITVKSFAKINLSIDVKGLLPSGYHDVEMVMQQVGLYDLVNIAWEPREKAGHDIKLTTNKYFLPTDERNLAYKAAKLLIKYCAYKIPNGIIHIDIAKKIPVAAGLAGGSGNGAAVLHGLNKLWDLGLSVEELCKIGQELGSDVPFSIMGQARANRCLGEKINRDKLATSCGIATDTGTEVKPIKGLDSYLILVKPSIGVSTKEVYQGIDSCHIDQRPDNNSLIASLEAGDKTGVTENMINVLENYTLQRYPVVREIEDLLRKETNSQKVLMSGSGPTVFALYDTKETAKKYCQRMRDLGFECYWAKTTN